MRIHSSLCMMALLIAGAIAGGRTDARDAKEPIDVWLEKAVHKDHSTRGMRHAAIRAREMWDAEMNRVYQSLMKNLALDRRATLEKSQKAWLAFRDAEFDTNSLLVGSKRGTMWPLIADENAMEIVRTRALQLKAYARHAGSSGKQE